MRIGVSFKSESLVQNKNVKAKFLYCFLFFLQKGLSLLDSSLCGETPEMQIHRLENGTDSESHALFDQITEGYVAERTVLQLLHPRAETLMHHSHRSPAVTLGWIGPAWGNSKHHIPKATLSTNDGSRPCRSYSMQS